MADRKIFIKNGAYIPLTISEYHRIKPAFEFDNQEYIQAQNMGVKTNVDPIISFIEKVKATSAQVLYEGHLYRIPRYYKAIANLDWMSPILIDGTTLGNPDWHLAFTPSDRFNNLYPWQVEAMKSYLDNVYKNNGTGIISMACGKGKTITALAIMRQLRLPTLILVDQVSLANQWKKEIKEHLGCDVGIWIAEKKQLKPITIATLQSLHSHAEADKLPDGFFNNFGVTVLDECHVAPAWTFYEVMIKVSSRYILGLSATVERADGLTKLVNATCGPILYQNLETDLQPIIEFIPIETVPKEITKFVEWVDNNQTMSDTTKKQVLMRRWAKFATALTESKSRNTIIADRVKQDVDDGHVVLILTGRKEHAEVLTNLLNDLGVPTEFAISNTSAKNRDEIFQRIRDGKTKVLVATSVAKKGLDIPPLSCLHLVCPQASKEFTIQGIGRILRFYKGKTATPVRDYVDYNVGAAWGMFWKRRKIYQEKGWKSNEKNIIDQVNSEKHS